MANGYTYPLPPARVTQGGSALEIQQGLKNPSVITKRLYEITQDSFISDYLLTERPVAVGGSIVLENGDELPFTDDDPQAIAPGGEYPLTTSSDGTVQIIRTTKWGLDQIITDESISRRLQDPVARAFTKLGNSIVRYSDGIALAVIAARITSLGSNSVAASGSWVGDGSDTGDSIAAKRIVRDVFRIKAQREEANQGFSYIYDTVVLRPTQLAIVKSEFINSGILPRESANGANSGVLENVLGLNWATSTHAPFTDPFFVDRSQLGGIATENIESPGYGSRQPIAGGIAIEAKAMRDDERDQWRLRGRRVAVPYVLDAKAGFRITGTGL